MRALIALSVALAAGSAWGEEEAGRVPTAAEIRSGVVIDNGLDIPRIEPGTQYFDIKDSKPIESSMRRLQGREDPEEEWLGLGPLAANGQRN